MITEHLQPKEVFTYFEEISKIPHGSGNIERISNYLVDFAKKQELEYYQDQDKNVIIIKEATKGYEDRDPVMLQGHMDMVAVKKPESSINMKEEGLQLMNANPYANGSVIFTQNGYYSREFANRTHGGMVGINVGIPVPVGMFPFNGHKLSFFGDQHCLGKDGIRFYTRAKTVTKHWYDEESRKKSMDTWEGTVERI